MSHKMTREFAEIFNARTQDRRTILSAYSAGMIAAFFATECAGLAYSADAADVEIFDENLLRFADDLTEAANRIRQRVAEAN
jgi:predicted HAD superfamily Cof-like phosphohydrolase